MVVIRTFLGKLNHHSSPVFGMQKGLLPVGVLATLADGSITHRPAPLQRATHVWNFEGDVVRPGTRVLQEAVKKIVGLPFVRAEDLDLHPTNKLHLGELETRRVSRDRCPATAQRVAVPWPRLPRALDGNGEMIKDNDIGSHNHMLSDGF